MHEEAPPQPEFPVDDAAVDEKPKGPQLDGDQKYYNKAYCSRVGEARPMDITVRDVAHRLTMTDIETFSLYICAPRRSGKTYLIKHLLYHIDDFKQYDAVFLFSGSAFNRQFHMIPNLYQYDGWSDKEANIIFEIMERQQEIIEHNEECTEESEKRPVPEVLIVLDDVMGVAGNMWQGRKSEILQALFFKGRHLKINIVLILQLLKGFSRVRSNSDMCVVWRSPSHLERRDLVQHHLTCESSNPESVRAAERFYEACFQSKYHCCIIDLAGSGGKTCLTDYCYSCVADDFDLPKGSFGIGPEHHWTEQRN